MFSDRKEQAMANPFLIEHPDISPSAVWTPPESETPWAIVYDHTDPTGKRTIHFSNGTVTIPMSFGPNVES